VLIAGGYGIGLTILSSAELYDPATGTWAATASMRSKRAEFTATLLLDGTVVVSGGQGGPKPTSEIYAPATGTWSSVGNLIEARTAHTATLLPDGRVLVVAGFGTGPPAQVDHSPLATAEIGANQTQ
jgi:hypothetical protein